MAFSTVFVHVPDHRGRERKPPVEMHRDARDPQGDDRAEIERMCRLYSEHPPRLVRVYPCGLHVSPWRKQPEPVYEARAGHATPDFA